ncbi:3-hexulose-6-phosphate synthase [Virgibacillus salexigens]|uniref:3-hexulose-6-phosphate synthase n=1 Tax=Virgibacillus massiliensis TaxID=1462526 RepID=A0A024Q854_9BACI|nr:MULTISPECIES: 3-hexulose-6-phosphate synthase [Virgibacillus]MYL41090.1 Fe-S cluster assembly protein HesB [Virgibacillus massiliensis]CDQ38106.1 3-hexulose-6-phosphate synthase [Virgibacillus massiliensis]
MKLQLALDRLTKEACLHVISETKEIVDIIEIGTGVIKEYGMAFVREIREKYPDKTILADMKTCDAGKHEAKQAFDAGADLTTVMAFSSDATIKDTLDVAKQVEKQIMIDLLELSSHQRMEELKRLGVELVSLHVGKDQQTKGNHFNTELFSFVNGYGFKVAVAGGIREDTLPEVVEENPDIIIVGSAISKSPHPQQTAQHMKKIMQTRG